MSHFPSERSISNFLEHITKGRRIFWSNIKIIPPERDALSERDSLKVVRKNEEPAFDGHRGGTENVKNTILFFLKPYVRVDIRGANKTFI